MTILALEFSSQQRSVAILSNSATGLLVPPVVCSIRTAPRTLNAFSLIETALHEAKLQLEEIQCLAVGLGPGSYTGIRAAISISQGWQLARKIPVLGISSVEALAFHAQAEGIFGRVNFLIDAQRHEFYLATCEIEPADVRWIEPLRLAAFTEAAERVKAGQLTVGPEVDQWFPEARVLVPDAGALAKLAVGRSDFMAAEQLQPIYLRETNFVKAPPPRNLPAHNS